MRNVLVGCGVLFFLGSGCGHTPRAGGEAGAPPLKVIALRDGVELLRRTYAPASGATSVTFVCTVGLVQDGAEAEHGPCPDDVSLAEAHRWVYWSRRTIARADVAVVTAVVTRRTGGDESHTFFLIWDDGRWTLPSTLPGHEQA